MSIHIGAQPGDIAETVLISGDPLRAKFMAQEFLDDAVCYNEIRGMYGFTGTFRGKKISIQGTGMGIPSTGIYVHELINEFQVKNIIRIGSCGSFQRDIRINDIVIAMSASTDSSANRLTFSGKDYAAIADFHLLNTAYSKARDMGINPKVGGILSTDFFYQNDPDEWKLWASYGILAVEMESNHLYTLAAKFGVKALGIMTVSDSLTSGDSMPAKDRELGLKKMTEIALETGISAMDP